jgi:hypothetical protein
VVRQNDEDDLGWTPSMLFEETQQLRRIAGLNIIRAAHIAGVNGDDEVAKMLISEASVMLSVATKVEELFEPPNSDVNL